MTYERDRNLGARLVYGRWGNVRLHRRNGGESAQSPGISTPEPGSSYFACASVEVRVCVQLFNSHGSTTGVPASLPTRASTSFVLFVVMKKREAVWGFCRHSNCCLFASGIARLSGSLARPSPRGEDLATLQIPNSIPGKPRNSLKSWSWRWKFYEASRKATKKSIHPPHPQKFLIP